ncbi:hypothetical protein [Rubellimicrobium roseum]|uniref:Uncharacterized protein n=1 Tax=Rubellimicrobium roseum TaxID=687525 RepID=A0A5C4NQH3_9RHOB|nr:hypothetical protein [Rubellimicrobium roseum]TNC74639.1 hypothetical protein FHG71_00415 [Rubellimicrobium roseum]
MTDAPDRPWLLTREAPEPLPRVLMGLFGLPPLWGAWDLVVRPWPAALTAAGLPALLMGLVALGLGTALLGAALLAPEREVHVDPLRREIRDSGRVRGLGSLDRRTPFDAVEEVAVLRDRATDGPDRLQLVLRLRGRRRPLVLMSRPIEARAEIEALAARLRAALQP